MCMKVAKKSKNKEENPPEIGVRKLALLIK